MQIVKQSAAALFLAVISSAVAAHPHSFITLKTEIVANDSQLTGLKMRWTMDEMTSADLAMSRCQPRCRKNVPSRFIPPSPAKRRSILPFLLIRTMRRRRTWTSVNSLLNR